MKQKLMHQNESKTSFKTDDSKRSAQDPTKTKRPKKENKPKLVFPVRPNLETVLLKNKSPTEESKTRSHV